MRVHADHWSMLLDFAERNPSIITNKFNSLQAKSDQNNLWNELVNKLNSLGYGEKSRDEWKNTLTDWKSETKAKAGSMRTYESQTGGGPFSQLSITSFEERLLKLMGKSSYEGNPQNIERGLKKRRLDDCIIQDIPNVHQADDHSYATQKAQAGLAKLHEGRSEQLQNIIHMKTAGKRLQTQTELPRVHQTPKCATVVSAEMLGVPKLNLYPMRATLEHVPVHSVHKMETNITESPANFDLSKKPMKPKIKPPSDQPEIMNMHNDIINVLQEININMTSLASSARDLVDISKK